MLVASTAAAQTVTRVIDGDTVVIDTIGTVRLIGVDTPETVDPRKPVQAFGREAADFLRTLIGGQTVKVVYDQVSGRTDRYGRTLAYLYLMHGNIGLFVNAEIIARGYGFAYLEFQFIYADEFRRYEREARDAGRGLWAEKGAGLQVFVNAGSAVYHLPACRYVTPDSRPMALTEAAKGHRPCAVCKPPK